MSDNLKYAIELIEGRGHELSEAEKAFIGNPRDEDPRLFEATETILLCRTLEEHGKSLQESAKASEKHAASGLPGIIQSGKIAAGHAPTSSVKRS